MSVKRCPKRECHDCKHVVDIEEDAMGRDRITCELDECEHESCIKEEPSVFKCCPMCGHELTMKNMSFIDEEGYPFEAIERIIDLSSVSYAKNNDLVGVIPKEEEEIYDWVADYTAAIILFCGCGFYFWEDAESVGFPDEGWFDRFCEKANRRWKE